MNKICILLPCHIIGNKSLKLLSKTIDSLYNQTYNINLFISISFINNKNKDIYKTKFIELINNKYPNTQFFIQDNKIFQLLHIKYLLQYIQNYDLIMFCENYDKYKNNRVEIIINNYNNYKTNETIGIVELKYQYKKLHDHQFYYNFAIKPIVLNKFFEINVNFETENIFNDINSTLYLTLFLNNMLKYNKNIIKFIPSKTKYIMYNNNPNNIYEKHCISLLSPMSSPYTVKKNLRQIIKEDFIYYQSLGDKILTEEGYHNIFIFYNCILEDILNDNIIDRIEWEKRQKYIDLLNQTIIYNI